MIQRLLRSLPFVGLAIAALAAQEIRAETVKVGVLLPYTGPFAAIAQQMDDGIKMYMESHASSAATASRSSVATPRARSRTSRSAWHKSF
jgi:outer membrane PBP1 activator LpoA protein